MNHENRKKLNSAVEINTTAIKNTIYKTHRLFLEKKISFLSTPEWYRNLRKFIFETRLRVFQDQNFSIAKPTIIAKEKEKGDTIMRPIANYSIWDKLILSLTNKYLTPIFDQVFFENSTAFRQRIGSKTSPKHHDVIVDVKNHRIKNIDSPLYVAECDIKKFFDCVHHTTIRERYFDLKSELYDKGLKIDFFAENIFDSYLNSYSFSLDVYIKNGDQDFWKSCDKPINCKFGWSDHLENKYSEILERNERIGIPQGGALSGLLANILMHNVDKQLLRSYEGLEEDLFYRRYCDDMIIIHSDSTICQRLFEIYKNALLFNKLEYHIPIDVPRRYGKRFWAEKAKSKNTYLWSKYPSETYLPQSKWVSFLGYMIHYDGLLKVRKKSFEKQIKKHDSELESVMMKLKNVSPDTIASLHNNILYSFKCKLFSMAVGKVNLSNYRNEGTKMCWGDGFRLLENNKFLRKQLRKLDYSRGQTVSRLNLYLVRRSVTEHIQDKSEEKKRKSVARIGYPHSFFSLLERKLT